MNDRWNDIRTAPDDGTRVLVSDDKHVWISSQRNADKTPRDGMPTSGHGFGTHLSGSPPTKWQPLPNP